MATQIATAQAAGNNMGLVADVNGGGSSIFVVHSGSANANNYVARIDVDGSYNILGGGSMSTPSISLTAGTQAEISLTGGYIGSSASQNVILRGKTGGGVYVNDAASANNNLIVYDTGGVVVPRGNFSVTSGTITASAGGFNSGSNGQVFTATGGGTGAVYAAYGNSGNVAYIGTASSAGGFFGSSTAYSTNFGTSNAVSLHLATNNQVRFTIDSAGTATFTGAVYAPSGFNCTTLGAGAVATFTANGANSGSNAGAYYTVQNNGGAIIAIGNKSAIFGGAYDGTPYLYSGNGVINTNAGITSAGTFTAGSASSLCFDTMGHGTSIAYSRWGNNGSNTLCGVEQSTGGGMFVGGYAYASAFGNQSGYGLELATSNTVRMYIDASGNITYTPSGAIMTYSGAAGSWTATTIAGSKNGYGGFQFQDASSNTIGYLGFTAGAGGGNHGFWSSTAAWTLMVTQAGAGTFTSTCTATGFYNSSLRELKTDIRPIPFDALKAVMETEIVEYRYKDGPDQDLKLGFIADDTPIEMSPTQDRFDTNRVLAVTLQAVKQLSARIDALEGKE